MSVHLVGVEISCVHIRLLSKITSSKTTAKLYFLLDTEQLLANSVVA